MIKIRILVDADACPGKSIIEKAAMQHNIQVIMFCDVNHILTSDYSTIVYADSGFQSVDMKLVNEVKPYDVISTQDFGVAAMILPKKAYAISPKGYIYSEDNIQRLLFERHLSHKARKSGKKTSNPKKRNSEDDERLYKNLLKIINENIK